VPPIRLLLCLLVFASCARPPKPPVEDLLGGENLSRYTLTHLRGTRDGDHLDAEVQFGDGSSTLTVRLRLAIGAPTKLETGRWELAQNDVLVRGTVAERSVMFLGGQDGPPSFGGRFDLLDPHGAARYRITIPTSELKTKLP
jgi:hypothetical protein